MKTIRYYLIGILLLVTQLVQGQADTLLVPSTLHLGAGWGTNGGYTTFGMAGQYVQGNISGGEYTGKIGYLLGNIAAEEENLPPVASAPTQRFFYELGEILTLDGTDPEGQPIGFEITAQPTYGDISVADGENTQEVVFTPNAGLLPGTTFQDQFTFQVNEVNSELSSEEATVLFKFTLEDTEHEVTGLDKSNNTFTVTFADEVFNAEYGIDVNYYDISDPLNAQFINVQNGSVLQSELTIGSGTGSYSFDVDEASNSYLFNSDQVLMTVLVTTPNSYSSFNSFIIDNLAGGRIRASEDGEYFAVGSDLTVPENKSTKIKLIAVDFAGFDETPTIEWTKNPTQGVLGGFTLVESSQYLRVWESSYTSTKDVGAEDDFSFRVFNSLRNSYESATINMSVKNVNDAPKLAAIASQQVSEGGSKLVSLNYSDPDNELTVSASSSNENLTATIVDSQLSLSATGDFYGTAVVNVWVEEVGTAEEYLVLRQVNVTVVPVNDAPVLEDIADQTSDEDVTIEVPLEATDADGDVLIFSYYGSVSDPTLATLQFVGNTLKVVPRDNVYGNATVTVVADDGSGASNALSNTVSFEVTFDAVNDAPVFATAIPTQTLVENGPAYTINMLDYVFDAELDENSLNYSAEASDILTVTFDGDIATVTLNADQSGADFILITATDVGGLEASQNVLFNVRPEALDIALDQDMADITLDEDFGTFTVDITSAFKVADGISYIDRDDIDGFALGNTLFDITFDNVNNTMTLHSKPNVYGNEDFVLVGATSGPGVFQTINVDIAAVNDAPVISVIETQTVKEDGVLENLLIEIVDPEGDIYTYGVESGDQNLLADASIIETDNQGNFYFLQLTPEADQNGSTSITVTADDGDVSEESFIINVAAVNDLPYVSGSLSNLDEDGSFSLDINTLFDDIDSESLTYEVESKPDWMTHSGNNLSGTPSNDDVGIGELTIIASDQGGSVSATFEFEILNVNDAPTRIQKAGSRSIFTGESFSYDLPEGNFEDIDAGDDLTYVVESKPSWLANTLGTVSGTPSASNIGSFKVVYKATDGSGAFARDTLYLTVAEQKYEVEIELANTSNCAGSASSVTASGAFDYNWYDASDELLQEGGDTFESGTNQTVFVEGVDGQGITTDEKFEANVIVYDLPNVEISESDDLLEVEQVSGYTYVWFLDDVVISGADEASYQATESGNYMVTVESDQGCTATSSAIEITIVIPEEPEEPNEVLEVEESRDIQLYPVPARDILTVRLPEHWKNGSLRIINMHGQVVLARDKVQDFIQELDLTAIENGVYVLSLYHDSEHIQLKFIKE